jgi:ABC-type Fe3+ transport system permease subunit
MDLMSKRRARVMRLGTGALVAAVLSLFLLGAVAGAASQGVSSTPAARPTEVTLPSVSVPPSQPATTTASNKKDGEVFGTEVRVTLGVVVVAFVIAFFATRRRRAAARDEREAEEQYEAGLYEADEADDDEPVDPDDPYDAGDDEPVGV